MIVFISKTDWANVGYSFAKSLRTVGVDAKAFSRFKYKCNYPKKASAITCFTSKIANETKLIVFMHSFMPNHKWRALLLREDTRLAVFHGGTRYRNNPATINEEFNPIVDVSLIQTGELLGLGAKNEIWMMPPVDTDLLVPNFKVKSNKLTIGHFPSGGYIKGLKEIKEVVEKFDCFDFLTDTKEVPWLENIERMSMCDIYIESLKDDGAWGVTALEAAALGKIVIAPFRHEAQYRKEFGEHRIVSVGCKGRLRKVLKTLSMLKESEIIRLKQKTREWVENLHSFETVGKRFIERVL